MTRRSSSLVTICLDTEVANELISQPDGVITMVTEIGSSETIPHAGDNLGGSTDGILPFSVEGDLQLNPTLSQTSPSQLGICNKVSDWFKNCLPKCNCFSCWKRISEFLNERLEALNKKLNTRSQKSYLEVYFAYANIIGVSPFRFGKENQKVVWLKKVPYYVVNALAALDTFCIIKEVILSMIGAQEKRTAEIFMYMKNSGTAAQIFLRVGLFISLKFHQDKFTNAVKASSNSVYMPHLYTIKRHIESLLVCGSSFCVIFIRTHLGLLYGMKYFMVGNAEITYSLLCFSRSCEQVNLEELPLTTTTILMGLLGWAMNFAGSMLGQLARDGILFSALTLAKSANAFNFKRRENNDRSLSASPVGAEILTEYKDIKEISKQINSAFNIVFRFFLLANIFMLAVFIDEWFDPGVGKVVKGLKLTNVVFVCVTFYYANQTAKTGDRFREWMKKEENRSALGVSQIDVMMESSSTSIGLGRGAFYIYDSTLIGFASVVAAYFLGIVETRPQNVDENPCNCSSINSSNNTQ